MAIAHDAPRYYRVWQRIGHLLLRLLTRTDVEGLEKVPQTGPVVVAPNHLNIVDTAVLGILFPRYASAFAADKWQNQLAGFLMRQFTQPIFVRRGEADRHALSQALAFLRQGRALGVAPEGTRSRTGGLIQGKNGAVYLASRSGAPLLPVVMWGQEQALHCWLRFKRPSISVRIGDPIKLPAGAEHARTAELEQHTEALMLTLARMLPPQYRGVYASRLDQPDPSEDQQG